MKNNGSNPPDPQGRSGDRDPPPRASDRPYGQYPDPREVPDEWMEKNRVDLNDLRILCRLPEVDPDMYWFLNRIRDLTHRLYHCTWVSGPRLRHDADRVGWGEKKFRAVRDRVLSRGLMEEETRPGKTTLRRVVVPEELLKRAKEVANSSRTERSESEDGVETPPREGGGSEARPTPLREGGA